jgi:hypothetical protein
MSWLRQDGQQVDNARAYGLVIPEDGLTEYLLAIGPKLLEYLK